jgi:hypothetical protein
LAVISDARFFSFSLSLSPQGTRGRIDQTKVLSLSLDATNAEEEEEEGARFDERAPLSQSQKRVFLGKFRSNFSSHFFSIFF